jgi:hypothetical protein
LVDGPLWHGRRDGGAGAESDRGVYGCHWWMVGGPCLDLEVSCPLAAMDLVPIDLGTGTPTVYRDQWRP